MRGNPNWKRGGNSQNPEGRKRGKSPGKIIQDRIERFMKRNASPQLIQGMYERLDDKDRLNLINAWLPYVVSKKAVQLETEFDRLSDNQLDLIIEILNNQILKRKKKIKLLQAISEGKLSVEDLQPNKVYFFIQTSDRPGVYNLEGEDKEYTEAEYREFCDRVERRGNGSLIWNEFRNYPLKEIIVVKVYDHPEKPES